MKPNQTTNNATQPRVFVRNLRGKPLMPTTQGKASRLLKAGRAKVVCTKPYCVQLTAPSGENVQKVVGGIDCGYENVGASAVIEASGEELLGFEANLLTGMSERLRERSVTYRRPRRHNKTRYRAPRFDNRRRAEGSLAPSTQHKLDTHLRLADKLARFVPIERFVAEVANFDIQKIKKPDISGIEYQQGPQADAWNLREYVLHRDGHRCQNPACRGKNPILRVHHVGYWREDRSDRPENLISLCLDCHSAKNHQPGGFLHGWQPKLRGFRPETFMSTVRWRLVAQLGQCWPTTVTFGYLTKSRRIELGLEKSHAGDAFVIAGGRSTRTEPFAIVQTRRNNRSLASFRDARTGKSASGGTLSSGRTSRSREIAGENLRPFRGEKLSRGCLSIRRKRYPFHNRDLVRWRGRIYSVVGCHCKGARVMLQENKKSVAIKEVTLYRYAKGLVDL